MLILTQQELAQVKSKAKRLPKIIKVRHTCFNLQHLASLIFIFGYCCSAYISNKDKNSNPYSSFLISLYFYFALSIAAPFTGGHLNPVVSVVMWLYGKTPVNQLKYYLIGQITGGIVGAFSALLFEGIAPAPYISNETFLNIFYDSIGEMVGTFLFIVLLLYTIQVNPMKVQYFNYFFLALMLLMCRTYTLSLNRFTFRKQCINPIVVLSLQIISAIDNSNYVLFFYSFPLIIGQFIGSILGYYFFKKIYYPLLKEIEQKN